MRWVTNRLRSQSGFTLVELVVAMAIGSVVLGASFALLDSGARSSTRTIDRVDVTQRGRAAMTAIQRRLRSQTCPDENTPPIVSGDGNSVTFYTDTDGDPYFIPLKETLYYDSTWKGGRGAIRETTYAPTQSATQGPPWTYTAAAKNNVLAEDVALQAGKSFLTYYPYNDTTTDVDESASALTTPLSTTVSGAVVPANSVGKVTRIDVSFRILPGRPASATGAPVGTQLDLSRDNDFNSSTFVRNSDYTDTDPKNRVWGPRCG